MGTETKVSLVIGTETSTKVSAVNNMFTEKLERIASKAQELRDRLEFILTASEENVVGRVGVSRLDTLLLKIDDIVNDTLARLADGCHAPESTTKEVVENDFAARAASITNNLKHLARRLSFILRESSEKANPKGDSSFATYLISMEDQVEDILSRLDDTNCPPPPKSPQQPK